MNTQTRKPKAYAIAYVLYHSLLALVISLSGTLPLAATPDLSSPTLLTALPVTPTLAQAGQSRLAAQDGAWIFDVHHGRMTLAGTEPPTPLRIATDTAGFITLSQQAQIWSSDPASRYFAPALAGATTRTVRQLWVDQRGISRVSLSGWSAPGDLAVESAAPLQVTGDVDAQTLLTLHAPQLTISGALRAPDLRVQGDDWVSIEPTAGLHTRKGDQGGRIQVTGRLISSVGRLDASGDRGGAILLEGERLYQGGAIVANGGVGVGGQVQMHFSHHYVASAAGTILTNGAQRGGQIRLDGGARGRLYSSGQMHAIGQAGPGGDLLLLGQTLTLVAAQLDASGSRGGGQIRVGGGVHGGDPQLPNARELLIDPGTRIAADAGRWGDGGSISLWAEENNDVQGSLSARGGRQGGNGGVIETSARQTVQATGELQLDAPRGKAGRWQLDPKYVTVSAAPAGLFPHFALIDPTPSPGDSFGSALLVLSTGNIVVTDPYDDFGATDAGAVHLFDGLTGALISTLIGSTPNDAIGNIGITAVGSGNYVVRSVDWANGAALRAGAVTWGNGVTGVAGMVSVANSLVGVQTDDHVGSNVMTVLDNGNYLVASRHWDNGALQDVGAVTWGNGATGIVGVVSADNSLIGAQPGDSVGYLGVVPLRNGNYVVPTPNWDNGAAANAGAATWGNGTTGVVGVISAANSLVGAQANDNVGFPVVALTNGNYVIASPSWDRGDTLNAGAVTWGNGAIGVVGVVSITNSLVGSQATDFVGSGDVVALDNGNYVVGSPSVNSRFHSNVGAATWGNGTTGIVGAISGANSLVGAQDDDAVGDKVLPLANGNYVVFSPSWDNDVIVNVGAATWGNGNGSTVGAIAVANSLVGTQTEDRVGESGGTALPNGNYLVHSPSWDNGATVDAGAATWGNGATGVVGVVSAANSLVGAHPNDNVSDIVAPLKNSNYVVISPFWDNGAMMDAGAATWGNGATGVVGVVSAVNSLIGAQTNDYVGLGGMVALNNGSYLVLSHLWDNGTAHTAGAVTWGNGAGPLVGTVSAANSLVGSQVNDKVGSSVVELRNGNYVVLSPFWDNGGTADVGAVTWGNSSSALTGPVSLLNSLVGTQAGDWIGSSGMLALNNGNYLVVSPDWDQGAVSNAGAVTWVDGSNGQTLDGLRNVTAQNSLIGTGANNGIVPPRQDSVHDSFVTAFVNAASGRVLVGFVDPNQLTFRRGQQQAITVAPDFLAHSLNKGVAVTLQASSDLIFDPAMQVNNPTGAGGALTLQAGRSLFLNHALSSDDAPITLIANERLDKGVVDSERDPGFASLVMDDKSTIDAGAGAVVIDLRDGAGKSHPESGGITLYTIIASSVTVSNSGTSPNSGLTLNGPINTSGAQSYHTQTGQTTVAANLTALNAPIRFAESVVMNPGVAVNTGSSAVEFIGTGLQSLQATGASLGNLTHSGAGTLRLIGGLTLNGALHNSAGLFDANGQPLTVNGALTVSGGTYRPGVGSQFLNQGLTLQADATLQLDFNGVGVGEASKLQVTGNVDLTDSTLQLNTSFTPALGARVLLIGNDGNDAVAGVFRGLPEGAVFSADTIGLQISYHSGDGNDVALTVVPRPVTATVYLPLIRR